MDQYLSAEHVAAVSRPTDPVVCFRPHAATRAAEWFVSRFPGKVFYAVKANPAPRVLDALAKGGVRHFDVASIVEVRQVRAQFPDATLAFMHPIKSREAIREAYFDHGVRIFSLDAEEELRKIMTETGNAKDLTLCVRLAVDGAHAKFSLASKFGARDEAAVTLMQKTRLAAERLGVCFHVGSQTMSPAAYVEAMARVRKVIAHSGVFVDVVDVGGGFPAAYPGMEPPALEGFIAAIDAEFEAFLSTENSELWCEPGRALCAEAESIVLRVEARRDQDLYLNDGGYGALYDAAHFNWRYPVRALSIASGVLMPYRFYGPTCDDTDLMQGPFFLPSEIGDGDYIEVGTLGAYGRALAGQFNGFGAFGDVVCADDPFGTVYAPQIDAPLTGVRFRR